MKLGSTTLLSKCAGGVKLPKRGPCPECGADNDDPCGKVLTRQREDLARYRTALENIAGFGSVPLNTEWEHGLRDIIRSMTDCAREALSSGERHD